jgi:nitric oxide reductase NorE protein
MDVHARPNLNDGAGQSISQTKKKRLPGEEGVWMFVFGDMLIFALFFGTFLYYRQEDIALYVSSSEKLSIPLGTFNTILLLTSSLFIVYAVKMARLGHLKRTRAFFELGLTCGIGFGVVKVIEYGGKFSAGINVTTNDFFMYYFMFTGIHFVHVILGIVVLFILRNKTKSETIQTKDLQTLESGATYWHMVDLLWIVLFPLLYLLR